MDAKHTAQTPDLPQTGTAEPAAQDGLGNWLITWYPAIGVLGGVLIWLIDAAVDSFILEPDEGVWEAVSSEDSTELWMRTLVVIVMATTALLAQRLMRRQQRYQARLRDYGHNLERMVHERTRELEQLANHDALTQILNRRKLLEVMDHEMQRAKRYGHPLSVLLCDIDHFKQVNDAHGHVEGDRALRRVARALCRGVRQSDYCGRWGGEEFMVLLPHTSVSDATVLAEKLRERVAGVTVADGQRLTASFGVSTLQPGEEMTPAVQRADQGLYQAKRDGRNRVQAVEPEA